MARFKINAKRANQVGSIWNSLSSMNDVIHYANESINRSSAELNSFYNAMYRDLSYEPYRRSNIEVTWNNVDWGGDLDNGGSNG